MRHGNGKVDVPHPLAADDAARYFHAALLADHARVAHSFIFTTEALEVLGGSEDALTEEPIRFRALRAVVDGFRLGHFTAAPGEHVFGTRNRERDGIEGIRCGLFLGEG